MYIDTYSHYPNEFSRPVRTMTGAAAQFKFASRRRA